MGKLTNFLWPCSIASGYKLPESTSKYPPMNVFPVTSPRVNPADHCWAKKQNCNGEPCYLIVLETIIWVQRNLYSTSFFEISCFILPYSLAVLAGKLSHTYGKSQFYSWVKSTMSMAMAMFSSNLSQITKR